MFIEILELLFHSIVVSFDTSLRPKLYSLLMSSPILPPAAPPLPPTM